MINFTSFGDELQKLAESGYRNITGSEMLWRPEGIMGAVIPLDPAKREAAYRTHTMLSIPAGLLGGGLLGGAVGTEFAGRSPAGIAIGAGIGALGGGLSSWGLRELAAKGIRQRAEAEAIRRAAKAAKHSSITVEQ